MNKNLAIVAAAALLLSGCAHAILQGVDGFDESAGPIVAVGYFSHAEHLDVAPCPGTKDTAVVDCEGARPSARFVVDEVLFGRLPAAEVELAAAYTEHPERFPVGIYRPVLLEAGPQNTVLQYRELARTRSGDWAIPVSALSDLPKLPCSGERLLEPLPQEFRPPLPRRSLDEYPEAEVAKLRDNPLVQVKGGSVYFIYGVTLDDLRQVREHMLTDADHQFSACLKKR